VKFQATSIPKELRDTPGWTTHNNKVPTIHPNKPQDCVVLDRLTGNNIGFINSEANPYIIIDIDHPKNEAKEQIKHDLSVGAYAWSSPEHIRALSPFISTLPTSITQLFGKTYTEFSITGTGIHLVMKLTEDKPLKAYYKTATFPGQVSFKNNFMVFTGIPFPGAGQNIMSVDLDTLMKFCAPVSSKASRVTQPEKSDEDLMLKKPSLSLVRKALGLLTLDQSERLKTVYKETLGYEYEHYQYWLEVGMALHDYDSSVNGYALYLEWSALDQECYTGEKDVEAKWVSFETSKNVKITWRTLMKLANRLELDYPRQTMVKGKRTGNPVHSEFENFVYLADRFSLKLYEDDGFYVSGDKDICEKYFKAHNAKEWFGKYYGPFSRETLAGCILLLCQGHRYRALSLSTAKALTDTWLTRPRLEFDLFATWLDTPLEDHPDELQYVETQEGRVHVSAFNHNSNINYLMKCITLNRTQTSEALCTDLIKKTLMHIIKFREQINMPFVDNGGMLILIGPENTRKSTFFKLLLPQPLWFMRKEINMAIDGAKGMRDFIRYLGRRVIVQVDEFEGLMDHAKHGAVFKAIISGNSMSLTDIYSTHETELPRKAIIVATSNERKQIFSDNGTRRMWTVQVEHIDTDAMLKINWYKFYNDLRKEFRSEIKAGRTPWLLNQNQIDSVEQQNLLVSAKSDIQLMLEECFPWDMAKIDFRDIKSVQQDITGQLYTTREVIDYLHFKGFPSKSLKMSALTRALERYCGDYTLTRVSPKVLIQPKATVFRGQITQGRFTKWVLPTRSD